MQWRELPEKMRIRVWNFSISLTCAWYKCTTLGKRRILQETESPCVEALLYLKSMFDTRESPLKWRAFANVLRFRAQTSWYILKRTLDTGASHLYWQVFARNRRFCARKHCYSHLTLASCSWNEGNSYRTLEIGCKNLTMSWKGVNIQVSHGEVTKKLKFHAWIPCYILKITLDLHVSRLEGRVLRAKLGFLEYKFWYILKPRHHTSAPRLGRRNSPGNWDSVQEILAISWKECVMQACLA